MKNPENRFKTRLKNGESQIGIWNSMGNSVATEILAGAGFDWVLIDTEHAPLEVTGVYPLLQIMEAYPETAAVVRPAINDPVLIKRHLDQGAQTLLIPYVESPEEAKQAVEAMRYPPHGMRGVSGVSRASRFGRVDDYLKTAEEQLCLIVQAETKKALDQLEEIAAVDGVDAVFIGPADLSASLGYPGEPGHPEVVEIILEAIARLQKVGVPAGILTTDQALARKFHDAGMLFTAVETDWSLFTHAVDTLAKDWKE